MPISRRPELEKDNPVAPQIYVGPRRKRAMARKASSEPTAAPDGMATRLQRLVDAAEQFVHSMPPVQETDKERTALLEAISHAQGCLSIEDRPATRPRRVSKKR
ncbi:MAG: hypothetical protein H8K09_17035 [Nitrospira sp.]|jgi:hypothetical protein|nr:hypothetical protein [Nitrospira sp.]ULA67493.1 MAG: hypothetical protein LZF62_240100 [Nitrospira sp.]